MSHKVMSPPPTTILVVDDNRKTAEMVARMLSGPKRNIQIVLGGRAALEWFSKNADEVDLVLLDQTMPDLNGSEVAEAIWSVRPSLPIFLMSGLESEEIDPLLRRQPFLGFLKKPFRSWELHLRVQSVLGM